MEELTVKDIKFELDRADIRLYGTRFEDLLVDFITQQEALFKKHKLYSLVKTFGINKKSYNHSAKIRAYAAILFYPEIFKKFIEETNSFDIYLRLANDKYTPQPALKAMLDDTDDDVLYPRLVDSYWNNSGYGFPLIIRQHLLRSFGNYPEFPQGQQQIPTTTYVFDGQEIIFSDLPMLSAYIHQHGLQITQAAKRVKSSEINKLKRNLNSQEFFPKAKRLTGVLRHSFLGNLLIKTPRSFLNKDTFSLIQYLFRNIYINNNYKSAFTIFSYIKGLDKYQNDVEGNWEHLICKSLKSLTPNLWYEFDSWFSHLQIEKNINVLTLDIAKYQVYENWFRSYSREKVNYKINGIHERFVDKPFLKGTLFLFAAFGLVDLAYDEAITKEEFLGDIIDPYRSLKYFRLNDLGAFILGLTNEYTPPKVVTNDELFLSKDALIITTHEDNKKAKMLLKEYANEVGENRYATDFEKFTDKCYSIPEIKEKINDFKSIVGKLPENWQTFFDEIIENAYPIDELDNYKIFKIKNNPELIRTIARDEILKKWIIKAEQFHIIVLEKDEYKVKKRLRQLGYFIA